MTDEPGPTPGHPTLASPSYTLTRGRSGRFNFTFRSDHGELEGSVYVPVGRGQTRAELEHAVRERIRALVTVLAAVVAADRKNAAIQDEAARSP